MSEQLSMWWRMLGGRDVASCREAGRLMQTVLDGQAEEHTHQRVMRHLDACHRCGLEADTYRAIKASIAAQYRVQVDPQMVAELIEFGRRLTEQESTPPS